MIVNIEFLDDEPIENVMTSLNFKIDKTILFGFQDVIAEKERVTERFLKKYCGVKEVVFCPLSENNLNSVTKTMRKVIEREKAQKNDIFFDITGGENLILVAFGMLAEAFQAPMHMYEIETQELTELNDEEVTPISQIVPKQDIRLTLDGFIEMRGGLINYNLQKDMKNLDDPEFVQDIRKLWDISSKYGEKWNLFADFLRRCCEPDEELWVNVTGKQVLGALRKINRFRSVRELGKILKDCANAGVLQSFINTQERLSFQYKSVKIKELLWDAGSILEMHTFMEERVSADDCRVGVHLDWDGVIYNHSAKDTLNEIDVLSLHGVIPTFISCKNGSVNQMALYELETVADKFGGKYAKKVIAAPQGLNDAHSLRAKEMNIEIRS
ncbi:MAG: hypothetical protein IJ024_03505 [Lachnospiraceae bacterium]|nr:hypothetical protein [Lachnospiraceae bacterium]